MRVTDTMMSNSFLKNVARTEANVQKYADQLSSMKEVSKPSDNPLLVSQIMNLNNSVVQNEAYNTTIADAMDWTNSQDAALSGATDALSRIGTLIQSAATDTMNASDRQIVKKEILSEIATLTDALNTNFGGKYVFAGMNTTTKPFEIATDAAGQFTGIAYHGTTDEVDAAGNTVTASGDLTREIAAGVHVTLKTDGRQLLNDGGGAATGKDDLGTFLADVMAALDANDTGALSGRLLERASAESDNVVNMRSEIGTLSNRLASVQERNGTEKLNLEELRSNKQDVDLAEKYMQYTMATTAYQSSLAMGTKILQTNILDYL